MDVFTVDMTDQDRLCFIRLEMLCLFHLRLEDHTFQDQILHVFLPVPRLQP